MQPKIPFSFNKPASVKKDLFSRRNLVIGIVGAFVFINLIACFHAYKFIHFADQSLEKTKPPSSLTVIEKLKTLFFGINNPRPQNHRFPQHSYETITLKGRNKIECWFIRAEQSKGTVLIFHGFSGCKSFMLDRAEGFYKLGYSTLLVDFAGSRGSEGNQTSLGYWDDSTVEECFHYVQQQGEEHIILFGASMGAVAVMKALAERKIDVDGVVLECPFGSLRKTTYARFAIMNIPGFPLADLLLFWGGVQNGYWAFSFNPSDYAKKIYQPVLLLYGEQDKEVSREEIGEIYQNLAGAKYLRTYPESKHESYLKKYPEKWTNDVSNFLSMLSLKR